MPHLQHLLKLHLGKLCADPVNGLGRMKIQMNLSKR
jgi:hypothetical protein